MPRNRTKIRRTKSAPIKRESNPTTNNSNPTVASGVANGMSLGAGAAIGSSMIHSAMDLFTSTNDNNKTVNNNYCNEIIEQFKQCSLNNSDINNCKPYLELYNQCIDKNI